MLFRSNNEHTHTQVHTKKTTKTHVQTFDRRKSWKSARSHEYTQSPTRTHKQTNLRTHKYAKYIHAHKRTHTRTRTHSHARTHACTLTHLNVEQNHGKLQACANTDTDTDTDTDKQIQIQIHSYTHTLYKRIVEDCASTNM